MKKPNPQRQATIHAAGVARWDISRKRVGKKYDPNKLVPVRKTLLHDIIIAPENISIYDFDAQQQDYIKTITLLTEIEKHLVAGRKCCIDFSNTERITAAALVLVYATVETANKTHQKTIGYIPSKRSKRVNEAIKTSNLARLFETHGFSYSLDSGRQMPIVSSTGRSNLDEIIDYIQSRIYNDQMPPETEHAYGDAVSETINNVGLHAYPNSLGEERRWWLTCSTFDKKLYLAIYDQGVGIPKTVVDRPWFLTQFNRVNPTLRSELSNLPTGDTEQGLLSLIRTKLSDEQLIYLSMQGEVTGTGKDKHGQGSKSIMALVSETRDGVLWVFSNNGVFRYDQEEADPELSRLRRKFPGTLIQWNIEIP